MSRIQFTLECEQPDLIVEAEHEARLRLLKTCLRHANRLPENQLELVFGPHVVSRSAIAGVLNAALHDKKATVRPILLALVNNPRRLRSTNCVGSDVNHARGYALIKLAADCVPHKEIMTPGSTGASTDDKMASEVHLLVGIARWIATKTPEFRSLVPVTIAKIGWLHHAMIDIGTRKFSNRGDTTGWPLPLVREPPAIRKSATRQRPARLVLMAPNVLFCHIDSFRRFSDLRSVYIPVYSGFVSPVAPSRRIGSSFSITSKCSARGMSSWGANVAMRTAADDWQLAGRVLQNRLRALVAPSPVTGVRSHPGAFIFARIPL